MLKQLTSAQNPLVKHLVKVRQDRAYRYEQQSVVIEGIKLIEEFALRTPLKTLVVEKETLIPSHVQADEIFIANENILKKISGMQQSEGIIAEIKMPQPASLANLNYVIAFDGVSEPGNMGTLLRSALALGWEGAFILDNSCDPFNEKALRAARGATIRLPVNWGSWQDLKSLINENSWEPIAADLKGDNLADVKKINKVLLVLGNEAKGISDIAKTLCRQVTIPMPGDMESLNVSVAGGIMMYVLRGEAQ